MTVSEKIDQFITNNGGNERDALNAALSKIERVEKALNDISETDINLITEVNEYHITKDVYGAAKTGFGFALDIISEIIK